MQSEVQAEDMAETGHSGNFFAKKKVPQNLWDTLIPHWETSNNMPKIHPYKRTHHK